jgi:very-short-patch-repair endonuclease
VLLARGDLGYWRWLIWIEYDGWEWHSSREKFGSDRHRDRWLNRRGWEVLRITDRDLANSRSWTDQLRRAIAEAPARISAMSPATPKRS